MHPVEERLSPIQLGDGLCFRARLKLTPTGHWHRLKYLPNVKASDRASEILNLAEIGLQSLIARSKSGAQIAAGANENLQLQVFESTTQLARPASSLSPGKVKSAFTLPKSKTR